jgi:hypothetical protein
LLQHDVFVLARAQIVTYMTKDRFKQNRKKTFKGHNTAGYACQVNFSPDSKYVMSGMNNLCLKHVEHTHQIVAARVKMLLAQLAVAAAQQVQTQRMMVLQFA